MSYNNRTDQELAADLAELSRAYAKHKLAVIDSERDMKGISDELVRRLNATRPPARTSVDSE